MKQRKDKFNFTGYMIGGFCPLHNIPSTVVESSSICFYKKPKPNLPAHSDHLNNKNNASIRDSVVLKRCDKTRVLIVYTIIKLQGCMKGETMKSYVCRNNMCWFCEVGNPLV
jgi:hypothetical protein